MLVPICPLSEVDFLREGVPKVPSCQGKDGICWYPEDGGKNGLGSAFKCNGVWHLRSNVSHLGRITWIISRALPELAMFFMTGKVIVMIRGWSVTDRKVVAWSAQVRVAGFATMEGRQAGHQPRE
jgi:hypothetical protein